MARTTPGEFGANGRGGGADLQLPPPALQTRTSRVSLRRDSVPNSLTPTEVVRDGRERDAHQRRFGNIRRVISGRRRETTPPAGGATPTKDGPKQAPITVRRDVREYLPGFAKRFMGWRPPGKAPPFEPLPFPPFSWLRHIPLKYEVWLLSFIGSLVGIGLIEIVMSTAFADKGIILVVGSFGASAVLCFSAIDSPLAQPRHFVGGQVISAIVGVGLTRCFRHAHAYKLSNTTVSGDLGNIVWVNGALSMAAALLAMQITGTVHPPGGATALIASVMPAAVEMSWRYVYIVLISALLMLGWSMIINNVGRRRYPTYWLSGGKVFVLRPTPHIESADNVHMQAVEGRSNGFALLDRAVSMSEEDWNEKRPPGFGTFGSRMSPSNEQRSPLDNADAPPLSPSHSRFSRSPSRSPARSIARLPSRSSARSPVR